ncbi:unnamed protein product [Hermetia illucens]|uniref:Uncharacterized protein n=1 Tax=Hermetia illucens TaxID=343691 RepID=A0A7R8UL32_HERIL|nr:unnamed protein product [Hermetia illucens]
MKSLPFIILALALFLPTIWSASILDFDDKLALIRKRRSGEDDGGSADVAVSLEMAEILVQILITMPLVSVGLKDFGDFGDFDDSKHSGVANGQRVHAGLVEPANSVTKGGEIANEGYVIDVGATAVFATVGIAIAEIAIDAIATAEIEINVVKSLQNGLAFLNK